MASQDTRAQHDEGLKSSAPPAGYEPVCTWTLDRTLELATVRHELAEALRSDGTPSSGDLAEVPERMILVASELASNALEHGHPPTIITLGHDGTYYLLDVADHDPHSTPVLAGRRTPGAGGFGLQIARLVGRDVGWYTTGSTKHIWVTFPATHHH